eukprot:1162013-Pelagomonas_calceolata.AAC.5
MASGRLEPGRGHNGSVDLLKLTAMFLIIEGVCHNSSCYYEMVSDFRIGSGAVDVPTECALFFPPWLTKRCVKMDSARTCAMDPSI